MPSPSHVSHAPYGELKEKLRGASSSNDSPQCMHARCSENTSVSGSAFSFFGTISTSATPSASFKRGLERISEPALDPGPPNETVDDDFDLVLLVAFERQLRRQVDDFTVDPGPREALPRELVEEGVVLPLAAPHDRRQHLEAGAVGELQHPVDDLLRRLARDELSAVRAVRDADPGVKKTEVVVDLGDGADRRARVARRRLLVDRDRRRQALDEVDVGLVHLAEELPRVRRQRLDVAALTLGVDRVERQRRLARAREPGEHDQLIAGEHEVDVAEVVLARPRTTIVSLIAGQSSWSNTAGRTPVRRRSGAARESHDAQVARNPPMSADLPHVTQVTHTSPGNGQRQRAAAEAGKPPRERRGERVKALRSQLLTACVASTVTALAVGGIAFAAIPSSTGVITGCYDNKTGALRIIDTAKTRCGSGSHTLKWNQQGAPGVTGAQGPPGQAGAPGPAGVAASGVRTIDIRQAATVGTGATVNYSTPIDLHDCRDVTSVAIAATSVGPSGFRNFGDADVRGQRERADLVQRDRSHRVPERLCRDAIRRLPTDGIGADHDLQWRFEREHRERGLAHVRPVLS